MEFSKLKKEWWATYHTHVRDELMCCTVKCLSVCVKAIVGDVEDMVRSGTPWTPVTMALRSMYIRKRHWILWKVPQIQGI